MLLINQIIAALTDMTISSNKMYSEYLHRKKIVEFIEQHLHRPLRITDLAQACGMSERNLRRKWKNWSRRTLSDEINHRRMQRACQLLLVPDISIAEVGYQVGIDDPAQFSRQFKKVKNIPPSLYRRQFLEHKPGFQSRQRPFQTDYLEENPEEHLRT